MLCWAALLPAIGGIGLFLIRPKNRHLCHIWTMLFTLFGSALTAWCILTSGSHEISLLRLSETMTVSFLLDGTGRLFAAIAALLWPLSTLYAFEYMEEDKEQNRFFGWYMLSFSATLSIAFSKDLMTLYLFYELLSLTTLPLVMHGMSSQAVHAGRKYVRYMLGGAALGFVAMAGVTYFGGGSVFTAGGIAALQDAPRLTMQILFVLGFLGFGVKAAVFPFHSWLPAAAVAPTPVTALLHAVAVVKAGAFAVIRLTYNCFGTQIAYGTWAQYVCLGLSMVTILYGSSMAVRESHMKRRLAYSTMSNLSYVLMGAMLLTGEGLKAGLTHMVFHALMKITLFMCVGAVMVKTERSYVDEWRGIGKRIPVLGVIFFLCALSLTGIPPLPGFHSKWMLVQTSLEYGTLTGVLAEAVLLISATLTCVYILVPSFGLYVQPADKAVPSLPGNCDPGWRMLLPLVLIAVLLIGLSFCSGPLIAWIRETAQAML